MKNRGEISVTFRIDNADAPITLAEAKEMLVRLAIYLVDDKWLDELAAELVACAPRPKAKPTLRRVK